MAAPKRPLEEVDANIPTPQRLKMSLSSGDECTAMSSTRSPYYDAPVQNPTYIPTSVADGECMPPTVTLSSAEPAPTGTDTASAPAAAPYPITAGAEGVSTPASGPTAPEGQRHRVTEKLERFRQKLSPLPGHVIVVSYFSCHHGDRGWDVLGVNTTFDAGFELAVQKASVDVLSDEDAENDSEAGSDDEGTHAEEDSRFDRMAKKAELVNDKVEIDFGNIETYDDNENIIRIERMEIGA